MECTFCGKEIVQGTGKIYIKDDGKVWNFCNKKCEMNTVKLGRKGRNTSWTKTSHDLKSGVKKWWKEL